MPNKKEQIRKEAKEAIAGLLKKHNIAELYVVDIDTGSAPVLQPSEDDNFTYVLDRIEVKEDGTLVFAGSSAYDDVTLYGDNIPTDALLDTQEWLEGKEEELRAYNCTLTPEEKDTIKEQAGNYLIPVFTDGVERTNIVDAIIDDVYSYIMETCEWDEGEGAFKYNNSDIEIAVQSILYHKIVK